MNQPRNSPRPWWAYIDTALLVAILMLFLQMSSWQGQVNEWRVSTDAQLSRLAAQSVAYTASSRDIAILATRIDATDAAQREVKGDILARLDRQDRKLDAIADRIDKLRNGK